MNSVGGAYDVFLSFRGEDTRNNFTDHLYHALRAALIHTFLDDHKIEAGDKLKPDLEAAIRRSKASIIVLSKNYADSTWCLDELALILEEKKKHSDRIVIPIFYHVDPSHLRKSQNSFGDTMDMHLSKIEAEETDPLKKRQRIEHVERWKAALEEVADLKGYRVEHGVFEWDFIQKIVREISEKLGRDASNPNLPLLIGRNDLVIKINSWLADGSSNAAHILTICGIAGIGKTTLARYIYDLNVGLQFHGRSFLQDIGLSAREPNTMLELQKKLLSDIGMGSQEISDVVTGTNMIQEALRDKKLLLVIDDVNDLVKLNSLLGNGGLHPGTKLIITTNDESLPQKIKELRNRDYIQSNYNCEERLLEGLSEDASLELLCKHAFGHNCPEEDFEELSREVAAYCGGHPLALEVLGRSLYQYGRVEWEETVEALSKDDSPKIQKALQVSLELLEYPSDEESFKHIACFFVGEERNYVETILDACGVHPLSTIPSLINKRLLTIDRRSNKLKMHQLLQEMGRDMVHQESPGEPGERSRLWCHDESFNVLRLGKGSANIKGLILDMEMLNEENLRNATKVNLKTNAFKQMERLELLKVHLVIFKGPYRKFPKSLKWLCWHRFHLESIPRDLKMENLVVLDMSYSKLKRWEMPGRPRPLKIKELLLRSCYLLESLSSLPSTITLLDVWGCRSLKEVTFQSDINEPVPRQVEMSHCVQLTEVQGFFKAGSVKEVDEKVLKSLDWFGDGVVRNLETMILEQDLTKTMIWKKVPAEVVYEFGIFSISFLGEKIPDWLIVREKKKGPSISFTVPSSRDNQRFRGLNVCSAHTDAACELLHKSSKRVKITNTTKKLTWIYEAQGWDVESEVPPGEVSKDMVLLSHWRFGDKLEAGDEVTVIIGKDGDITMHKDNDVQVIKEVGISFLYSKDGDEAYHEDITMSDNCNTEVIEEVGSSLVYRSDDVKKDEQIHDPLEYYNDKCWKHVIGGDLSPFQLCTGEYHLISQRPRNVWSEVVKNRTILLNENLTGMDSHVPPGPSMVSSTPSSSSSSIRRCYQGPCDVFLSFQGENVDKFIVGHLYYALTRAGICACKDDLDTQSMSESLASQRFKLIEESRTAIVICSEQYASSSWCLDELAHIMRCNEAIQGYTVMPVFYGIGPWDVRTQNGRFGEALKKHTSVARMEIWRQALTKVANISGWYLPGRDVGCQDSDYWYLRGQYLHRQDLGRWDLNSRINASQHRDDIVHRISQKLEEMYPDSINEKMMYLKSTMRSLIRRKIYIVHELQALEIQQPGKHRQREVLENWLEHVEMAKTELESLKCELGDITVYSFSYGQLGERLRRLTEQVASLNNFLDGIILDAHKARVAFPTTVLGETLKMNCEEVLWYLKSDQVSSISIYGMGGIGKTTVMKRVLKEIYDNRATFGDVCWVSVSQNFSIKQLQNYIFEKLDCHRLYWSGKEISAAFLSRSLKAKGKYMLILDDVWDDILLEKVGIPVDESRCKLIIMTRSLDVCNKMVCQRKIKISPLLQEEAWELFMEKLGPHKDFTPEVIEIAKHMVRMCGGFPLAIITLAGSMMGVNNIDQWRNTLEELKEPGMFAINGGTSEVLRVLEYSYNHLGDEESQLCFLSCGLYPEDFKIPRHELIDYCIVKGLIGKMNRRAEIAKAITTLNKLKKCFLLECDGYDVKMHYLMKEMALQIMSRKQHVMVKARLSEIPEEEEWTQDLEVVSLIGNDIREIPHGRSPRCPKLSTLILQQNTHLTRIPDSFFMHMSCLRVLNLRDNKYLMKLPDSVGDLTNLDALWLTRCNNLKDIPSLRKLKSLGYLDLNDTGIKEVPGGVGELISLRCLYIDYGVDVDELMKLGKLEVFRGRVRNFPDYITLATSKWLQQLRDYHMLVADPGRAFDYFDEGEEDRKDVMLKGLNLGGNGIWEGPIGLKRLSIEDCYKTGKCLFEFCLMKDDARTSELKEINIGGCKEVEWVVAVLQSSSLECCDIQLTRTEKLSVRDMENMKGIFNWQNCRVGSGNKQSSFSRLKQLEIYKCDKMKVGLTMNCVLHLPVLEELHISDCFGMEEVIGGEDDKYKNSTSMDITLPNLKVLSLTNLLSLWSVYNKGNIICDSIEEINFTKCTKLKTLPLTASPSNTCSGGGHIQHPFPALKRINMAKSEEQWWTSLELVEPTYHSLLRSFLEIN